MEHYLTNYEWISSEEKYFGQKDTAYDFESHNIKESDKKLDKLQQAKGAFPSLFFYQKKQV